jgi:zeaxanthin glucosyltransferase
MTPFVTGHFNGMIGVAERLLEAAAEVGWACMGLRDPTAAFAAIRAIGARPIHMEWSFPLLLAGQEEEGRSIELRARRFKRVTVDSDVVATCREIIASFRPDAVAVDPAFYSGIIASHLAGVPYVCVHTNLCIAAPDDVACERLEIDRALSEARRELFERHGAPLPDFRRCESISPHGNSVWATASFLRGAALPADTRLVGPSIPRRPRPDHAAFDWSRLDGRPLVYASPGTVYPAPPPFLAALAATCARLDLQLVVVGGEAPAPAIAVRYAPQLEMLGRASLFVTHGGANSVMEGLTFGCPMLVAPLASDQPIQAHFVEASGAGRAVDPYSAGEAELEAAMVDLLRPAPDRAARVAELSDDYRAHDGAGAVTAWLSDIAADRSASHSAGGTPPTSR